MREEFYKKGSEYLRIRYDSNKLMLKGKMDGKLIDETFNSIMGVVTFLQLRLDGWKELPKEEHPRLHIFNAHLHKDT